MLIQSSRMREQTKNNTPELANYVTVRLYRAIGLLLIRVVGEMYKTLRGTYFTVSGTRVAAIRYTLVFALVTVLTLQIL